VGDSNEVRRLTPYRHANRPDGHPATVPRLPKPVVLVPPIRRCAGPAHPRRSAGARSAAPQQYAVEGQLAHDRAGVVHQFGRDPKTIE
jgi:hypothetical protein